jgi:hypothetical protein
MPRSEIEGKLLEIQKEQEQLEELTGILNKDSIFW